MTELFVALQNIFSSIVIMTYCLFLTCVLVQTSIYANRWVKGDFNKHRCSEFHFNIVNK